MTPFQIGLAGFGILLVLIVFRAPIALAMAITGLAGVWLLRDFNTLFYLLGTVPVDVLSNYSLSTLPLFILMGNVAAKSGMSTVLFDAFSLLCSRMKGGLAISTIITSGAFSAAAGSSLATTSAMARVATPEMLKRGYHPRLVSGAVAAGGTLGIMIPPSGMMIIYGFLTETSIGALFIAGILPGMLLILAFCLVVFIWVRVFPEQMSQTVTVEGSRNGAKLLSLAPIVLLFGVLMGGIYTGIFTPTEGAAVGAGAAIIISFASGRLGLPGFVTALRETAEASIVIYMIILGTAFFQFFMEASRVPVELTDIVINLGLGPIGTILLVLLFLALLGTIMEGMGILFLTVPILFPIVLALGFDPIWFGVMMVLVIELGLITPPVGLNIFILVSLVKEIEMKEAFIGILPFAIAIVIVAFILLFFPECPFQNELSDFS
ncbi:tripartite ATP-independent transporter DctM subunit [Paenochrobactrum gallinarii]|uniref:TRAP transporter large permease protein n=1 Tax=Paenochrobactrum gallinarii TaxID=643673 RepID=A0A841M1C1_9HYPH|nr:TRAP transporter large permease [Paenochrobactrum gallinarii]MBB6262552.1 tripartite ATP-independent transporter DctM subunit [Paenochrobactrum gallinarii]